MGKKRKKGWLTLPSIFASLDSGLSGFQECGQVRLSLGPALPRRKLGPLFLIPFQFPSLFICSVCLPQKSVGLPRAPKCPEREHIKALGQTLRPTILSSQIMALVSGIFSTSKMVRSKCGLDIEVERARTSLLALFLGYLSHSSIYGSGGFPWRPSQFPPALLWSLRMKSQQLFQLSLCSAGHSILQIHFEHFSGKGG